MRIKNKTKSWIKRIALVLAGISALALVFFGIKAIVDYTKNDLKKLTLSFDVGNLGSDGKYVNDESTLYTKEAFGCYGLQIKPDFDSTVNYQIFYYDILDNYISSTEIMSEGYSGKAPVNGAYARIVIEPRDDEDGKISLTERIKYPAQLTFKVSKDQDINSRFINFKGRLMQVVTDKDDLVFKANMRLSTTLVDWEVSTNYNYIAVTSLTVLKVDGGSVLKFDFSKLSESFKTSTCRVFQFKDLPLEDNVIMSGNEFEVSSGVALDKRAKYIIIQVESRNPDTWSESDLAKLPSCFSVAKTK